MERPKVRFCQSEQTVPEQREHEAKEIKNVSSKGRVKVKSIVPINIPIKVLENGQRVINKDKIQKNDAKELMNSNCIPSIYISEESEEACPPVTQIESRKSSITNESEISFYDVQSCIDEIEKMNIIDESHDNLRSDVLKNNVPIATDGHEDNDVEFIEIVDTATNSNTKNCKEYKISSNKPNINSNFIGRSNCGKSNMSKNTKKENKENFSKYTSFRSPTNKPPPVSNTILQESTKVYNKASTGTSVNKVGNKTLKSMPLMPCAKFKLATSSNKNKIINTKSQPKVKKSTVFHVMGNNSNVSVEAGTLHKNNTHADILRSNRGILSTNLLSRPEYNSMIGVMKSLKEIEKEKLVKDYEHLPKTYQNFVSEKVTAALNFSPYEAVYKDLIDLSIDDKLPTGLMRSKDPEPRDKDIVPKLSDFYNPKCMEQYFTVANPKPLHPINLNTLNAFTISNKVCTWKICRDNF